MKALVGSAHPLISILIPTYNRPQYLEQTVRSALSQTYPCLEIILSDNASSDDTPVVAASFQGQRTTFIRQPVHLGMTAHWNACLEKASGEFCILLSDDDVLESTALEEMARPIFEGRSEFTYSPFTVIDENGLVTGRSTPGPSLEPGEQFIRGHLRNARMVMPSGLLFRTSSLRALGGFPNIGTSTDFAVRLALATRGPVACCREHLLLYRRHSSSLSSKLGQVIASHLDLLKWAQQEPCLAPYQELLKAHVWQESIRIGILGGLARDIGGNRAASRALHELGGGYAGMLWAQGLLLASRLKVSKWAYLAWKSLRRSGAAA